MKQEGERMNREILFKAKRVDNGRWVVGGYFSEPYTDKKYIVRWIGLGFHEFIEVVPDTLCQYTGLADKNGKKIWENDILKAHLDADYPEDTTYTRILWNETGFYSNENHSRDIETLGKWDAEHFEVCGNIFDNPELLEVEE